MLYDALLKAAAEGISIEVAGVRHMGREIGDSTVPSHGYRQAAILSKKRNR